jgi:hypothetical protein
MRTGLSNLADRLVINKPAFLTSRTLLFALDDLLFCNRLAIHQQLDVWYFREEPGREQQRSNPSSQTPNCDLVARD